MRYDLSYLLKPCAEAIYFLVGDGAIRDFFIYIFRPFFFHLCEYADYLLFLPLAALTMFVPRAFRPHWLLAASALFLVILHGTLFSLFFVAYPALVLWRTGREVPAGGEKNFLRFWVTLTCVLFAGLLAWESFPELQSTLHLTGRV